MSIYVNFFDSRKRELFSSTFSCSFLDFPFMLFRQNRTDVFRFEVNAHPSLQLSHTEFSIKNNNLPILKASLPPSKNGEGYEFGVPTPETAPLTKDSTLQ